MQKIIFLAYTSQKYDGHGIKIERADLTRKMSCLETWVPRVEKLGYEVIFFDGGYDNVFFDKKNKILHTNVSDSYDYHSLKDQSMGSLMLERLKVAISWVLNNRDFDYIFRVDDGTYVNAYNMEKILDTLKDCDVLKGQGGGGGMFFSKKTCEKIINFGNEDKIHIEDLAIYNFLDKNPDLKVRHTHLLCYQYILSEDYFTIHYSNGKRQYTTDLIISYYHNKTPIERKVVLNYDLDYLTPLKCNTWDSDWEKTPIFYSFDKDDYNWEHYGRIARSSFDVKSTCPFAKNSISDLLFYEVCFDLNNQNEKNVFENYINSVSEDGSIYFYYETKSINFEIFDYLQIYYLKNSIDIKIEYLTGKKGNFYKLKKNNK